VAFEVSERNKKQQKPMPNVKTTETRSFNGIDLWNGGRVALWGRGHGGNLSVKTNASNGLKAAFDARGAQVWKNNSTPQGGTGYYKTLLQISWEDAKAFLEQNGYHFVDGENPEPEEGDDSEQDGNLGSAVGCEECVNLPAVFLDEVLKAGGNLEGLTSVFSQKNRFFRYRPGVGQSWPAGRGVYVVRQISKGDSILYVGMTGRFKRNGDGSVTMRGGTLAGRETRWHPYSFTRAGFYKNQFEYGPNYSVNVLLTKAEESRYRYHVPFADIAVDCFVTDGIEGEVSPAFLETLILQMYMREFKTLPPANNQF
jgi:hypothetical protein